LARHRRVTCRRWNWRQARRTQLREETTTALFILDALDPMTDEALTAAADDLLTHLTGPGFDIRVHRRLLGARTTEGTRRADQPLGRRPGRDRVAGLARVGVHRNPVGPHPEIAAEVTAVGTAPAPRTPGAPRWARTKRTAFHELLHRLPLPLPVPRSWATGKARPPLRLRRRRRRVSAGRPPRGVRGLPRAANDPGHERATAQLSGGYGGVAAFAIAGEHADRARFVDDLRLITSAVSLG
jgi:hypothetical protein